MSFSVTGRFWGRVLFCLLVVFLVQVDVLPSKANSLNAPWHEAGAAETSADAGDRPREGETAKASVDPRKGEGSANNQVEAAEAAAGEDSLRATSSQSRVLYTRVVSELVKTFYIA